MEFGANRLLQHVFHHHLSSIFPLELSILVDDFPMIFPYVPMLFPYVFHYFPMFFLQPSLIPEEDQRRPDLIDLGTRALSVLQ